MALRPRFILLWLFAEIIFGQSPEDAPPDVIFRASVRAVQVSVIAQDKQGKPITDLRREEFLVFDNDVRQDVRLFVPETAALEPVAPQATTAITFTNRAAQPSGPKSGYSVILIDNLFADFGDPNQGEEGSGVARVQALRMLHTISPDEKIAIYATGRKLQVICEFTSDRDLLDHQLRKWKSNPDILPNSVGSAAFPGRPLGQSPSLSGVGLSPPALPAPRGDEAAEARRIDSLQRAAASDAEMLLVADHLAGIPGRKNLIWLSNRFLIGPRAIQSLANAGISLYPVDMDGVCRVCPPRPTETMDAIAAITGGKAYYYRNDIDIAIREAIDDGRVSYTLGFYRPDEDAGNRVHRITVRVSRPGVVLRYRGNYQSDPRPGLSRDELAKALNRPMDATAIPIEASATRDRERLDLAAALDVRALDLEMVSGVWKGTVEFVARFVTADGVIASEVIVKTLTLNLKQASYDSALETGLVLHQELQIPAGAAELKLLFSNPASQKIGTLTIPMSKVPKLARK